MNPDLLHAVAEQPVNYASDHIRVIDGIAIVSFSIELQATE
jgi:hypothetical protein